MEFRTVYNALNTAQKKAVDAIEGAVMVVAGPGTGKTQVLGARIANILSLTDTNPENILCLTFTEAATVALRNRLYDFIGSSANRVNIHTYHAFCNMIIQENKSHFGMQELDAVSELEVLEIVREIIDELDNDHPLKRFKGEVYFDSRHLIKLFGLMKKDRLNPEKVKHEIQSTLAEAENAEEYRLKRKSKNGNIGDLNTKYFALKEQLDKLLAACQLLSKYNQKMLARSRYDFNDMINWVIDVLREDQQILLGYQERFQYVLVDEYQDTNGSQNELLYLLINYWDNPNVFVVGDDDQSIYKFQGANVENIHQFYKRYEAVIQLIVLTENYRSSPPILACSNALIKHNNERLVSKVEGLDKNIISSHPEISKLEQRVMVKRYPNTYQEIIGVAERIAELHKEGIAYKDMAVLYRNHKQSDDLIRYLQSESIPFNVSIAQDILEIPIVKQLLSLLEYLQKEMEGLDKGAHLLFEILHFTMFKHLSPFEIAKLAHSLRYSREQGWREQIQSLIANGKPDYLSPEGHKELKRFMSDVDYWIKQFYNVNLQSAIEQVMSKGGFISQALSSADNIFEIQCLKTFFNFVKEETAKRPSTKLNNLLETIDLLKKNEIKLGLSKVIHGADGVNLMTAHGSKGLEFDHVFILGCTAKRWEKDGQRLPFNLNKIIEGEPQSAFEEEGRRLFYVAATRAKRALEVSYAVMDSEDKPMNKSIYVHEIEQSGQCERLEAQVDQTQMMQFFDKTINPKTETFRQLSSMDFVDDQLQNFRMSSTNLNNYLRCPVSFFYQNIIRIPSAKNETMSFGTSIHYALEQYFSEMLKSEDKTFPDTSFLIQVLKNNLKRHKESFTDESFKRFNALADKMLPEYVAEHWEAWNANKDVAVEVDIKTVEVDGVPIRGILDKLVRKGDDLQVIDYKTGKHSNARNKIKPPLPPDKLKEGETDHNKIKGGDYWRQVVFYKLLIENEPAIKGTVSSGTLDFVEPEKGVFYQEKIVISAEDLATVKSQITESYRAIMNKAFDVGCNKEDCVWCNFNHYYLNGESFNDPHLSFDPSEEIDER